MTLKTSRELLFIKLRSLYLSPKGALGLSIVLIVVLIALIGPYVAPHDPYRQKLSLSLAPPSWEYPMGNDEYGRDLLSRLLVGARPSVAIGLIPPTVAALIGIPLGLLAGYGRTWFSTLIMRGADGILSFPGLLVALFLVSIFGPGLVIVAVGITIFIVPRYIRIVYGDVLSIREREFVLAAHAEGMGTLQIWRFHILPNIAASILVQWILSISIAALTGAALSFLGLGLQPPSPEWGVMISSGYQYIRLESRLVVFPGIAFIVMVLGFSLLGDAMRDAFDPLLRKR